MEKEIKIYCERWKETQEEMERRFTDIYRKPQQCKSYTGKKQKRSAQCNRELYSYAGSLTKEFLMKVIRDNYQNKMCFRFFNIYAYIVQHLHTYIHSTQTNSSFS